MKWNNIQFGEFEYGEEQIITFPEGLIGFEQLKKFILILDEDSQPFRWLVSLEDSDISFPVIEPHALAPEYVVPNVEPTTHTVLVVVTLREPLEHSTMNLRSPLILENQSQHGRQVILDNDAYPFQFSLFSSELSTVKG
jgi:flagellar assembly factor FliW